MERLYLPSIGEGSGFRYERNIVGTRGNGDYDAKALPVYDREACYGRDIEQSGIGGHPIYFGQRLLLSYMAIAHSYAYLVRRLY